MTEKLLSVSPNLILPATNAKFEIYLKQEDNYVLYTRAGERFSDETVLRLQAQAIDQVFIPASQEAELTYYIERHIASILKNTSIPVAERADVWNKSASSLAQNLFEEQLPPALLKKRFERFQKLLQGSVQFFKTKDALKELSRLISKGFDIYHHGLSTSVLSACVLMTFDEIKEDQLPAVCGGAMLHDIGKMRLPAELLKLDPDRMGDDERRDWETHPALGVQISATIPLPPEAIHCVLFHHEREDGKGFPTRTPGSGIPTFAKVVALCERYDNLTRNQPYRHGMKPFEALKTIRQDAGFCDPEIFTRLVQVLSDANITKKP
ncbi:HD domain-containing phosphohydrolase [Pseudodesulfovibrio sp. zrk46]|uniref:HD-GYP domain-containing protein n=1 Tax=Pseudodesulfovibrio sp. zrk46 TaxID=2725288 RepID=UPI0014494BE7|nr:HD domain-containing phosphohydrolase [Pseudodesulfovibrio sp. zrk46]QJB57285.1 HD domain-containing protein [Pseudodesulfovibrio sp. zrk46]